MTYQKEIYRQKANAIYHKGFNGLFIKDWRPSYVGETLTNVSAGGIKNVIIKDEVLAHKSPAIYLLSMEKWKDQVKRQIIDCAFKIHE